MFSLVFPRIYKSKRAWKAYVTDTGFRPAKSLKEITDSLRSVHFGETVSITGHRQLLRGQGADRHYVKRFSCERRGTIGVF